MGAWSELSEQDEGAVWSRFAEVFNFIPSVTSSDWPGIHERRPFRTYSIEHIYGHPSARQLERDLEDKARIAFQACAPSDTRVYALDWQHQCYWLRPHELVSGEPWAIPALPDGDYYIFLEEQFEYGWFGHPWEQTICVFGTPLLRALDRQRPELFTSCIRSAI
jgi:hypothetical protein